MTIYRAQMDYHYDERALSFEFEDIGPSALISNNRHDSTETDLSTTTTATTTDESSMSDMSEDDVGDDASDDEAAAVDEEDDNEKFVVEAIVGHTVHDDDSRVQLHVKFAHIDQVSIIPEEQFQHDCPDLVYQYWKEQGTREVATNLHVYHVFDLLDHRVQRNRLYFLVQWVGFSKDEANWERANKIGDIAKPCMDQYLNSHYPEAVNLWFDYEWEYTKKSQKSQQR